MKIRILVLSGFAASVLLCVLQTQGYVASGWVTGPWGKFSRPGPLFPLHIGLSLGSVAIGAALCLNALRQSHVLHVRLRAKYWLLGAGTFVPLGFVNYAVNYGAPIFPTGSVGNIVLVLIFAYAAARHRLMDVDRFVMRAAATLLASLLFVLPLAAGLIWAYKLPSNTGGVLVLACLVLAAMLSLLLFARFRSTIEQEIEASCFPSRRVARDTIRQLSADLVKLPHNDDLYSRLAATLRDGLEVIGVAIYLAGAGRRGFALACSRGEIEAPDRLSDSRKTMLSSANRNGNSSATCALEVVAEELGWEACLPITAGSSTLGFVAVGTKQSGARIDDSDLALLNMVAAQLAIAMQNIDYVQQIETQKAEIEQLRKRLEAENVVLRAEVRSVSQFTEIIGASAALQRVLVMVERVAPTTAPVLITGETGTGKELIARAIHDLSPRRSGPLISVNCPAIPAGLAESELFGHERGAFTDAVRSQAGKFELADGGTIFLDEIADLSLDLQVKLLRVLQEHETQRVGSTRVRKLDLRVVAATNRHLVDEMHAGRFREDLYYRLAAIVLEVPALRERTDDIPMLASYFLERAATMYQKPVAGFSAEALERLRRYSWPGNIRELQNVIERAVLLCASDTVTPAHLADLAAPTHGHGTRSFGLAIREEKLRRVERALAQTGGNQAAAARLLGISANNLARLMKSLGLKSPRAMH
jgi:transcriptional regulator with GAF, ATPase, and Fis domain